MTFHVEERAPRSDADPYELDARLTSLRGSS